MQDVFIICPKAATERRAMLVERFAAIGCAVNFIDAVMGDTLTDADKRPFLESNRQFYCSTQFRDNEIACAISHHKVWQIIAEGAADFGFIFEDDAVPFSQDTDYVQSMMMALAGLGKDVDFVALYQGRPKRKKIHVQALTHKANLTVVRFQDMGAVAYMIAKPAARKLLANPYRYSLTVDILIHKWWLHDCDILHIDPPLFIEDGRTSILGRNSGEAWIKDQWYHKIVRRCWHYKSQWVKRIALISFLKRVSRIKGS